MARFFLPRLRPHYQTVHPVQQEWCDDANATHRYLKTLPNDLFFEGQVRNENLINAVPTMFARPLLFAEALADSNHPLHVHTVTQWRGILAAIALNEHLHLNIAEGNNFTIARPVVRTAPSWVLYEILDCELPGSAWRKTPAS